VKKIFHKKDSRLQTSDSRLKDIYKKLYERFGPQHWWPGETPFEVAIGAILTQNTAWSNVAKAIRNLKKAGYFTPNHLWDIDKSRLSELIRPSGYFNIKAERLKAFLALLHKEYKGSMKRMGKENPIILRERLLGVRGIGPETADSILLYALDKPIFVIDAYTKRVLSRHKILEHNEPYERFQALFHSSLKKDVQLFNEYHALFVRVGKTFCKPRPICDGCPLKGI
jgi:endonuclease-3 related protein